MDKSASKHLESPGTLRGIAENTLSFFCEIADALEDFRLDFMETLNECIEYEKTPPSRTVSPFENVQNIDDDMILPLHRMPTAETPTKSA